MFRFLLLALAIVLSSDSYATEYLTTTQAQQELLPNTQLIAQTITLTPAQITRIEDKADVYIYTNKVNAWRSKNGTWFIRDQVIGKHENIDYAIALTSQGKVIGLRVLVYRETYGDQVRHLLWLAQFIGRGFEKILRLDTDIDNISGATLSCKHITDGVNKITAMWQLVLQHRQIESR